MEEIWKDIPDYEGLYQVSNLGRVKSLPKEWLTGKGGIKKHNGIFLKQCKNSRGYYTISIRKENKQKTYSIHQVVAIAFLGHIPNGLKLVVDHINDNKLDNRAENLQIVTQRFNVYKTQGNYSSKYKGVYRDKYAKKWRAQIKINGKKKYLGLFDCELKAHLAYEDALKNLEQTQPF